MDVHKDFADLCSLLNAKGVEYLFVGGYAVAFHGAPRFTGDLDLWVKPDAENVAKMLSALRQFGFPTADLAPEHLLDRRRILQIGRVPLQVHLMTAIDGVAWEDAWASRAPGAYSGIPVSFIGLEPLLANKRAVGRPKDLADVDALERSRRGG